MNGRHTSEYERPVEFPCSTRPEVVFFVPRGQRGAFETRLNCATASAMTADDDQPLSRTGLVPAAGSRRRPRSIDHHVGAAVRRARCALGLSEQDAAARIGVTPRQYGQFERGDRRIPSDTLLTLANYFRVPVATFFLPPTRH